MHKLLDPMFLHQLQSSGATIISTLQLSSVTIISTIIFDHWHDSRAVFGGPSVLIVSSPDHAPRGAWSGNETSVLMAMTCM